MKFNANAVSNVDQSTVEQDGVQFPSIMFMSGDPQQKKGGGVSYHGGWFIDGENSPDGLDWEEDSFITLSGEEIEGYYSPSIQVSVIGFRRRWIADNQSFSWGNFKEAKEVGSPRSHVQYLVLLKGFNDPFVVTLKGHSMMSFAGTKPYAASGVLSSFTRTVIAAANTITKPQKWPYRAFWLTVKASTSKDGSPAFIQAGKGDKSRQVVIPVPDGLPESKDDVSLDDFYIGDDLLATVNDLFKENEQWLKAWDNLDGTAPSDDEVETTEELDEEKMASFGI